jgi:hypothetical protein
MKKLLSVSALMCLSTLAFCQWKVLTINVVGLGLPQQMCSWTGDGVANASFSGTELNEAITGSASSLGPTTFVGTIQGNIYWTVQYTGSTPPPSNPTVTCQFSSGLVLAANYGGISCSATLLGDEVFGVQSVSGTGLINKTGQKNEIVTSVGLWTEVSPGVWQAKTGYYSPNVSMTCFTTPPPAPGNTSGGHYTKNVKIILINNQPVTGN